MTAYIQPNDTERRINGIVSRFQKLEQYLVEYIFKNGEEINLKELNEKAEQDDIKSASGKESRIKDFRTILYFLATKI